MIISGIFFEIICGLFFFIVKTYEDMTLEELEENEDEFGEDDEAAIEMYRWAVIDCDVMSYNPPYAFMCRNDKVNEQTDFQMSEIPLGHKLDQTSLVGCV